MRFASQTCFTFQTVLLHFENIASQIRKSMPNFGFLITVNQRWAKCLGEHRTIIRAPHVSDMFALFRNFDCGQKSTPNFTFSCEN